LVQVVPLQHQEATQCLPQPHQLVVAVAEVLTHLLQNRVVLVAVVVVRKLLTHKQEQVVLVVKVLLVLRELVITQACHYKLVVLVVVQVQ
jgi:hypothetical protein